MDEKHGFRVGDRVIVSVEHDPEYGVRRGQTGIVCDISSMKNPLNIGVRWDEAKDAFHTCNMNCDDGHGWFVPYGCISLLQKDIGEITQSDHPIDILFGTIL